ncbi:uncharacterized protein SOCEGT47_029960 [Sorangium cellulosum]|uniref:Uncharacterized protein n=1 Tax=Sorangium cellulosum TaxID=56 RepID=A0A4P2Q0Y4_SORCE|nr:uncharacterized protein SOCEGT47_029960 [Sorangium cellulosum]
MKTATQRPAAARPSCPPSALSRAWMAATSSAVSKKSSPTVRRSPCVRPGGGGDGRAGRAAGAGAARASRSAAASAAPSSSALSKRSRRSFARQRATTSATFAGTAGPPVITPRRGGRRLRWLSLTTAREPQKGGWPASSSKRMTPTA